MVGTYADLTAWRVRVICTCGKLLDSALGGLEPGCAEAVQLLAPLPEQDRLVDRDIPALELPDDLLELGAQLLEAPLGRLADVAHGRTSETVATNAPTASSISTRSPAAVAAASRSAWPPERTTA